jgi:hypothetical protein
MTEPLDDVHAMSIAAIANIRAHVGWYRSQIAAWEPRPYPGDDHDHTR